MADKNPKHPLKKKQAKAKDKKKHIYEQVNAKDKNPVGSLMRTGRVLQTVDKGGCKKTPPKRKIAMGSRPQLFFGIIYLCY